MKKYLYGASVQGIQSFIFNTGKLREIVGASSLVESICTRTFQETVGAGYKPDNLIVGAAGNIKYIFDTKKACEALVWEFPKKVAQTAPGVQFSQAIVSFEGDLTTDHLSCLEKRLQEQRNKVPPLQGLAWMTAERSRKTGNAAVGKGKKKDDYFDLGQEVKREEADNVKGGGVLSNRGKYEFPQDISKISSPQRSWVAVIHADGNDLGLRIMRMKESIKKGKVTESFRTLSQNLQRATEAAARGALHEVFGNKAGEIPFRPIILGGDDITVIIEATQALKFTERFLDLFQRKMKEEFENFDRLSGSTDFANGLSACAGIAFVKGSYPFHYAADLADDLCKYAKKVAKGLKKGKRALTPACLAFHKVHASFVGTYEDIHQRELLTKGDEEIDFRFGPYFLNKQDGYASISELRQWVERINGPRSPKAQLRNWLGELQHNNHKAAQRMNRILNITGRKYIEELPLKDALYERKMHSSNGDKPIKTTPLFDIISLSNIN